MVIRASIFAIEHIHKSVTVGGEELVAVDRAAAKKERQVLDAKNPADRPDDPQTRAVHRTATTVTLAVAERHLSC